MELKWIAALLHIGSLIKTEKDIQAAVEHLFHHSATADDAKAVLDDLASLFTSGVVSLSVLPAADLASILGQIKAEL